MKIDLIDRDAYDIVTALRGPDTSDELGGLVKRMFTMRLRHWVGISASQVPVKSGMQISEGDLRKVCNFRDLYHDWWDHWAWHMEQALQAVAYSIPEVEREAKILHTLLWRLMQHRPIDKLVEWAKESKLVK